MIAKGFLQPYVRLMGVREEDCNMVGIMPAKVVNQPCARPTGEAAAWEPHAEFVRRPAIRETMHRLQTESLTRTAGARRSVGLHPRQICPLALSPIPPWPRVVEEGPSPVGYLEQDPNENDC